MIWSCKLLFSKGTKTIKITFKMLHAGHWKWDFLKGERIWDTWGTIPPRAICIIKYDHQPLHCLVLQLMDTDCKNQGTLLFMVSMSKSLRHTASHGLAKSWDSLKLRHLNNKNTLQKNKMKQKILSPLFPVVSEFRENVKALWSFSYWLHLTYGFLYFFL